MLADILAQVGQTGTVVVGSFGIFVALRNQHRQLNAQMFVEFSGQFQELLREFPTKPGLRTEPRRTGPAVKPRTDDCTCTRSSSSTMSTTFTRTDTSPKTYGLCGNQKSRIR